MGDGADLTTEANRINYRLRSTFFYRKMKEYGTLALPLLVAQLFPVEHLYSWQDRALWGVGEDAFTYINGHAGLHLIQVFCHPKLIREHPQLITYYRHVAALSQKGVHYLAKIEVKRIEEDNGNRYTLGSNQALALAQLFNEHISLIVDSSIQSLTESGLYGLLLISTGSQIDGSWRNAIGEEAERVVQRLIVTEAKERNLLAALIPRVGLAPEPYDATKIEQLLGNIERYRGIMLSNQTSVLFSSDPDVSLVDAGGVTVCAIEVKGGADPAGALERYGAAKKSFEAALRINPQVKTILVASCITNEVHGRIQQDPTISAYYNLTELLSEDIAGKKHFMDEVFSLLGT